MEKPSAAALEAARSALVRSAEQAREILALHLANGVEIRSLQVEIDPSVRIAPGAVILAGCILRGEIVVLSYSKCSIMSAICSRLVSGPYTTS